MSENKQHDIEIYQFFKEPSEEIHSNEIATLCNRTYTRERKSARIEYG